MTKHSINHTGFNRLPEHGMTFYLVTKKEMACIQDADLISQGIYMDKFMIDKDHIPLRHFLLSHAHNDHTANLSHHHQLAISTIISPKQLTSLEKEVMSNITCSRVNSLDSKQSEDTPPILWSTRCNQSISAVAGYLDNKLKYSVCAFGTQDGE